MEEKEKIEYDESIRILVATRLETLPDGAVISVGADGEFTKEQIIESVIRGDEIGQKMVEIEMSFLQGLKQGVLYDVTNKNKNSHKEAENIFNNTSTFNSVKNVLETYSASIGSITSGYIDNSTSIIKAKNRNGLWKSITKNIIITISDVLGAVIRYFIFGIK